MAGRVNRRRAAKYQSMATAFDEDLDEVQGLADVGSVVVDRPRHGIGDNDKRRAMNDSLDIGIIIKDLMNEFAICDVALVEHSTLRKLPFPGDQAIQNDGPVAGVDRGRSDCAPDEAGTAGNKKIHVHPLETVPTRHEWGDVETRPAGPPLTL